MEVLQDAHGQIMEASLSLLDWIILVWGQSIAISMKLGGLLMIPSRMKKPSKDLSCSLVWRGSFSIESSHAIALAKKVAAKMTPDQTLIICLSGRGDKDVMQVKERF